MFDVGLLTSFSNSYYSKQIPALPMGDFQSSGQVLENNYDHFGNLTMLTSL